VNTKAIMVNRWLYTCTIYKAIVYFSMRLKGQESIFLLCSLLYK